METLNGIEILSQTLIYEIQPLWLIIGVIVLVIGIVTFFISCDSYSGIGVIIGACIAIPAIIILCAGNYSTNQNWFNHSKAIQYTIEIIDDNVWKEIGPRFKVIEKIYDNKEIYIIEEDLTSSEN